MTGKELIWGTLLGDTYCNRRGVITLELRIAAAPYLLWKWELLQSENMVTEKSRPPPLFTEKERKMAGGPIPFDSTAAPFLLKNENSFMWKRVARL